MEDPEHQQTSRSIASLGKDGRYRCFVEAVTDYAIYFLDISGFVISWNAGAQRFNGYQEAEILGQHVSVFYTDEDREAGLPARALATAAAESRFEDEGWRLRKDGTRFWASAIIDTIHDLNGQIVAYAKITRDLTERRSAQLALTKAREVMFQSQNVDAIGRLTGGVAHEFNNSLAVILGNLEQARDQVAANVQVARLIDNALLGVQRGASLTDRMLAFARRQELNLEPVNLLVLLSGMTDFLERLLGPSIVIETRFPPKLSWVTADAKQLEMAVLKLAVNARDAMPEGGSLILAAREEITPSGQGQLPPGAYVCLSLTDGGCGMDEVTLVQATNPFFTTKEFGKGTGLGLSIVYGLALQSGGQLLLKSKVGEGTTVEIWLPVAP